MYDRCVGTTVVFYDGVCGLCNWFVQFLLRHDRQARLRFAPLQGRLARELLVPQGVDPSDLDTVYVVSGWQTPHQRALVRSRAVLHAIGELGGAWSAAATLGRMVPSQLADIMYKGVARIRYKVFGRYDTCPMPKPEWKDRMIE